MNIIKVLPAHLADLIAAGEVVERPASVVKELLENAIDAGATACTVEIRNGGLTYIRVTDNGCGMSPGDAKTAFLRHATSKIRTERDLEAIETLGFRGEALAAIAAVARVELLTCARGADIGTALELDGGGLIDESEAGCPSGTTLIVRNLFYNTPARLKFLKKDAFEAAAVHAMVQKIALGHPGVSIKYLRDGAEELHSPGDSSLESCVYAVLGRDVALGLLPAVFEDDYVRVEGFVSSPRAGRGNRGLEFFFVNGRAIRSAALAGAVEAAYRNRLLTGRFPACVLNIEMKPGAVDVNVHPAKIEVRFFAEGRVASAVNAAAKNALENELNLEPEPLPAPAPAARDAATPPEEAPPVRPLPPQSSFAPPAPAVAFAIETFAAPPVPYTVLPAPERGIAAPAGGPVRGDTLPPRPPTGEIPPYTLIGEALDTYIVVQAGTSLLLIDKHAAHERRIFDALLGGAPEAMPQALLDPERFTPPPRARLAILENLSVFEACGFEIEDFGAGALLVRTVPAGLGPSEVVPLLEEIADDMKNAPVPEFRLAVLRSVACKAAIKAGKASDPRELRPLIEAVLSGEIKYCPHGRPVSAELTKTALEKLFKR